MVLFDRAKITWLIILGVTPPDAHTLSASVGVPDESGTGLTIHRPSPDNRDTFPAGEVFHEIRFFHRVEGASWLNDLWSAKYRQGHGFNEGIRITNAPITRFNRLLRRRLGRGGGDTNNGNARASV